MPPQPDAARLKARQKRYRNALPVAAELVLFVERADTSIEYDRRVKPSRSVRSNHSVEDLRYLLSAILALSGSAPSRAG